MSMELGIPRTLKEMNGVQPADFGVLAELAVKDACMADNLYTVHTDEDRSCCSIRKRLEREVNR